MTSEMLDAASLAIAIAGLGFIWFQLRQAANSSKASLLISINRDLNAYGDVAVKIEQGATKDWVEKLDGIDIERLLDYISYFEGLYLAHRRGLFSLREINDYFSGRFFRLANNTGVQTAMLLNRERYEDIFRPIFLLHKALLAYRSKSSLPALYPQSDLASVDRSRYREMAR
jgi:hypothetical protein